jgi:hypothetical protein
MMSISSLLLDILWICYTPRSLGAMELRRIRILPSVQDDWRAWLPDEKAEIFNAYSKQLEDSYAMFSVALNEALELRRVGLYQKSQQAVAVIPALGTRLASQLAAILRALGGHCKHYGTTPNAAPLDASNFRGAKEQRSARMSNLLNRVLLTQRSQFLDKISTLHGMVSDLGKDLALAVENIGAWTSDEFNADWLAVDSAHYDLNTCLRETIILLKSSLLVTPGDQLDVFQKAVIAQLQADERPFLSRPSIISRRRIPSIAGQ